MPEQTPERMDPRPQLWRTPNMVRDHQQQSAAAYGCVAAALEAAMTPVFEQALRSGDEDRVDKAVRLMARVSAKAMQAVGDELLTGWTSPGH